MSRIFLSHSSRNNAEALALRDWLATQGWNDVFLDIDPERGLVASDRWQKALNAAIGRCRAVIFLLSPEWRASEHCISELDLALHAGAERIGVIIKDIPFDRIPTGLGGESQLINLTRGGTPVTFTVNPPPKRETVTVTFPDEDLRALRSGLARLGLVGFDTDSFPWPPVDQPNRSPFRGLEALDVKDAGVFYGRDNDLVRAREELIELRAKGGRRLFAIQGSSGSGKSSFMRAGLLPRLDREDRDFITLPLIRPGTAAISGSTGLAVSLEQAFEKFRQPKVLGDLLTNFDRNPDALPPLLNELQVLAMQRHVGQALPQVERPPTIVIAIDQAEELFSADAGQEADKLRRHLAAAVTRGPDTIGILTIRSDSFSSLQRDPELKRLLQPFNLPPLEATVYRDTIQRPAARINPPLKIEAKLSEALIKDTAAEGADTLPLLAFTLENLYRSYGKAPDGLRFAHYEALGGIGGSIDQVLAEAQREAGSNGTAEHLRRLIIPGLATWDPTANAAKRIVAQETELLRGHRAALASLADALVKVRLLTRGEGTLDVAHEALLRRKPISEWLEAQKNELKLRDDVLREAKEWVGGGRHADGLVRRGERLQTTTALAASGDFKSALAPASDYLKACRKLERSARSRARWTQAANYTLLLGIIGGMAARMNEDKLKSFYTWATVFRGHKLSAADLAAKKPGDAFFECVKTFSIDRADGKQIPVHCPEMVVVPAGSYRMGRKDSTRIITIAQPLAVSRFTVTFDQWDACVAGGGCENNARPSDQTWGRGSRPAINVDWRDANTYVAWLNRMAGTDAYRLLSEAEWEYSARAVRSPDAEHPDYRAPRRRGTPVEEGSTQRVVDLLW